MLENIGLRAMPRARVEHVLVVPEVLVDLPPTLARSGPVRLLPHWNGWSHIDSSMRLGSP